MTGCVQSATVGMTRQGKWFWCCRDDTAPAAPHPCVCESYTYIWCDMWKGTPPHLQDLDFFSFASGPLRLREVIAARGDSLLRSGEVIAIAPPDFGKGV